jgi:2-C-methyl-D-erythritol 4-phosphate cytidylyltransferase
MNFAAIIPAGGVGSRFGGNIPKQFLDLQGKPVIYYCLSLFDKIESICNIIVPIDSEWKHIINQSYYKKEIIFVDAGKERQYSVRNALNIISTLNVEYILIHDAVRPCASLELVNKIIEATLEFGSAIPGIIPSNTIKISNADSFVKTTLHRSSLRAIQTPQGFSKDIIIEAYKKADEMSIYGTDDAYLVEKAGFPVKIVEGELNNIKITSKNDYFICQSIISDNTK